MSGQSQATTLWPKSSSFLLFEISCPEQLNFGKICYYFSCKHVYDCPGWAWTSVLVWNLVIVCKECIHFTPCTCTFLTCTKQSAYGTLKLKCSENEMSKQRKIKKANSEDKDKVVRLVLCNLCKYFWRMNHNADDSFLNPGFSDMLLFEFTGTVLYKLQINLRPKGWRPCWCCKN